MTSGVVEAGPGFGESFDLVAAGAVWRSRTKMAGRAPRKFGETFVRPDEVRVAEIVRGCLDAVSRGDRVESRA